MNILKLSVIGLSFFKLVGNSQPASFEKPVNAVQDTCKNTTVSICPKEIEQGKTAFINIKTNKDLYKPYYLYNGKALPIFKDNDSTYTGLFPTTPNYKPGQYEVVVSDSCKNFTDTVKFEVKEGKFFTQNLSIKSDSAKTLEEKRINEEEIKLVRDALNYVSYDDSFYEKPPYDIPTKGVMVTEYGAKRPYYHNGIDIAAPSGQPIKSILGGKVLVARQQKYTGNGGIVIIDHGRFKSVYLHMSGFDVKEGDTIKKGQFIGKVGNTGRSSGPHLHFGIYPNGVSVDPEQWLKHITKGQKLINRWNSQFKQIPQKAIKNINSNAKSSIKRTVNLVR